MSGESVHTDANLYLDAIRRHVCAVCQTPGAHSFCGVSDAGTCAVERFLPQIVEVATSVSSDKIDDYVSALRDTVCRVCRPDGEQLCSVRDSHICGLDRYFVLILEAIEQVILQKRQHTPS